MKQSLGRGGWCLAVALVVFTVQAAMAADAPALQPVSHFTREALMQDVEVSPSGSRMAVLMPGPSGRVRLAVMGLAPRKDPEIVAEFSDANITGVQWVNDERLVFEAFQDGAEVRTNGAGTFAVNHDGKGYRQLVAWRYANDETGTNIVSKVLPYGWFLHSTLDDDSADVLVQQRVSDARGDLSHVRLARLSTVTGELRNLSSGAPTGTRQWLVDRQGEPRLAVAVTGNRRGVHWRAPGATAWT